MLCFYREVKAVLIWFVRLVTPLQMYRNFAKVELDQYDSRHFMQFAKNLDVSLAT